MNNLKHALKWGIIFTIAGLAWMVLEKTMGWHDEKIAQHPTYTNIFAVVAIAVYVFALRDKRKELGGTMSWKQGFIAGVLVSVVVAVLSPLAQWITYSFISPDYFANAQAYSVSTGKVTQEQAESFFNLRSYILQASIFGLVVGVITSAIVALFVRRKGA
ncbi:MAG: DUF4199 domain-containing protein [Bacteroidota bacterium]